MATRKFGPTRGAGVRIEEKDTAKTVEVGALGWSGVAGLFRMGPVGAMKLCSTKTEFLKKYGSFISESLAPDAAQDFYDLAAGSGGLAVIRVTDGNEVAASIKLYSRKQPVFTQMGRLLAKNGGRWGGQLKRFGGTTTLIGDIGATTLQIETASATLFKTNEWKGGYIELNGVPNKRYAITGNTATGLISVSSDSTMAADLAALSSVSKIYYLTLESAGGMYVQLDDGEESSTTEFSMELSLDGNTVKKYGNLSTDPAAARYWVNIINNDDDNDWVTAVDDWTGAQTAAVRPANYYGAIASVTALVLTAKIHSLTINSPTGGNPTIALNTTTDAMFAQTLTVTMTSATVGTVVSDLFGAQGSVTLGTPFVPTTKWAPPFTLTAGATPLAVGNTLVIQYRPFVASELVNGYVYPDKVNSKRERYRITANDHKTITVAAGSDLTISGSASDEFMVTAPINFTGGRDGNADIADSHYVNQAYDNDTSPFNNIDGKNLGIVKFATPGVTSTTVQKAGVSYAANKNHQYRVEIPSNITTDNGALDYINDTIGRSDYLVTHFPSYCSVPDPDPAAQREGKRKTVSMVGMILGREAKMANDFNGYHRAAAGTTAILPRVLTIPTGDRKLNEELLNPAGINVIKKSKGNFVIWGDRTVHLDSSWKFKHQRELMSYYEKVLAENFDFIVFSINDADSDAEAKTALISFFFPEFVKRALRGKDFDDACTIKVDAELNTDGTRAAGDKIAEIALQLADTTERFIIRIGKQGIFESVA